MNKLLLLSLVALAGCASKPMSDEGYRVTARDFTGAHRCAVAGHLSQDTAARSWQQTQARLETWVYYPARLAYEIERFTAMDPPTREWCVHHGMLVTANTPRYAPPAMWVEPTMNMPARTICNRIGAQTLCSTY